MSEERRLVTVLFGDVVGSTSLGESLDPEDLRRLLSRFYEIASEVVAEHGGTLEKFIGDAAMAIFGLMQAHDDDARRALDAALDLRERLRGDLMLADRLPVRIGINTGEVVATRDPARSDFLVTGDAVNVAARLQQVAEPWQIVVTARTASADLGAHEFGPVIPVDLKGKAAAVDTRVLLGRASEPDRRRSPLVGRQADLAQLDLVVRRTLSERRPYLVSMIAPAGTGKSRLVEEFLARLVELPEPPLVATAQCLPYGERLTYWPLRTLLLGIVGLEEDASAEETRHRIHGWLQRAGAEQVQTTAELLAATIGASEADGTPDRSALFNAWRQVLELAAVEQALVLLIEDLHWSSDSLLDLIEFILQPRADSRMLLLALARPELLERRPTWGGGHRNHVSMALQPLDDGSIGELVSDLVEDAAPELVALVAQRAEGNPFYAGEIVRTLLEAGADLSDPDSLAAAARELPDTVQATVLSRLDALDQTSRRVLQVGSVFGRSFNLAGVRAIAGDPAAEVEAAADPLIERELVRAGRRGQLTFRHIIIRDVAYGTLPRSERAALHAAAGRWLEDGAGDREDELAELIAFHYREAATLVPAFQEVDPEVRAKALRWLRRAADVSAAGRAVIEAARHLDAALELAPAPEQPRIHQRLGEVHGSGDRAVEAYEQAWQLGEAQGMPASFLLENLGHQLMVLTRWFASVARTVDERQIQELKERGQSWYSDADDRARATYLVAAAGLPFWLRQHGERLPTADEYREADALARRGLATAEAIDEPVLVSAALDAMTGTVAPDWQRTLALSLRRTAMGEHLPFDERMDALNMVAWSSAVLGDLSAVIESSQTAVDLVQPGQSAGFALAGGSWNAYARALRGEWDELVAGIERLRLLWIAADRPAAAYGLQGFLSGIAWARNRSADQYLARWCDVADEIIGRFPAGHPVAELTVVAHLDLDGISGIVTQHERYPDRIHYVDHAVALCADHREPVPRDVLDAVLARAHAGGMRVLGAQTLRLRGVLHDDAADLRTALREFEQMGAGRFAARLRVELGTVAGDRELLQQGLREMQRLEESGLPMVATAGG